MADQPPRAKPKELTKKQAQALTDKAFRLERKIKAAAASFHTSWWDLAKHLYDFHEAGSWKALGYESLDEFLAQPDLGISRTHFFRMTKMWRDLVVVKRLPPDDLKAIEPSKVREVVPAIMRGEVNPEDALDDARELSYSDVRTKYRPEERAKHGQGLDDSTSVLNADDEPVAVQCNVCGSWYTPADPGGGDGSE